MLSPIVRGALVVVGVLLMLGGLVLIPALGDAGPIPGLEVFGFGAVLVVAVAIERQRYRSDAAERSNAPTGPGGGEPSGAALDSRFKPTTEMFIDPTTGKQMRVLVDPKSGERRYVAEG